MIPDLRIVAVDPDCGCLVLDPDPAVFGCRGEYLLWHCRKHRNATRGLRGEWMGTPTEEALGAAGFTLR